MASATSRGGMPRICSTQYEPVLLPVAMGTRYRYFRSRHVRPVGTGNYATSTRTGVPSLLLKLQLGAEKRPHNKGPLLLQGLFLFAIVPTHYLGDRETIISPNRL